jgi:NTP pyrophosphatase (non-canonical NTP hydrolase)
MSDVLTEYKHFVEQSGHCVSVAEMTLRELYRLVPHASDTVVQERLTEYLSSRIPYSALALAGEAGEFANEVKKALRDDRGYISDERRLRLLLELGDVLWYVAYITQELGSSLESVIELNVEKLQRRRCEAKV